MRDRNIMNHFVTISFCLLCCGWAYAEDWYTPYDSPRAKRQDVFTFTEKPKVRFLGDDKYEITFTPKGYCDATVSVLDENGKVIRHLASGVLGNNAPAPFLKGTLKQRLLWDGKDDLDVYVREPSKMKIRVALGLKPAFDRILGWHPHDSNSYDVSTFDVRAYRAIGIDKSGVYVLLGNPPQMRHYTHKGKYIRTVLPPPADMPLNSLTGYTKLEIEPDRWEFHENQMSKPGSGQYPFPFTGVHPAHAIVLDGQMILGSRKFLARSNGGNLFDLDVIRLSDGKISRMPYPKPPGKPFRQYHLTPEFIAASPDGKKLFFSRFLLQFGWGRWDGDHTKRHNAVFALDLKKQEQAKLFAGVPGELGSDNQHFQFPVGIECDAQGRVYVCDPMNRRIQVFSPKGAHLKTIKLPSAFDIRINRATGVIYVLQVFNYKGGNSRASNSMGRAKSGERWFCALVRLKSFEDPKVTASLKIRDDLIHVGGVSGAVFALDTWSKPVKLWVSSDRINLRAFEDRGDKFVPFLDFKKEVEKSGGEPYVLKYGKPPGDHAEYIMVDPTKDQLYLHSWKGHGMRWDLASGNLKRVRFPASSWHTPRTFDAKGYLYAHLNPCIARHDPRDGMREVPFDYGVEPPDPASAPQGGVPTSFGGCIGVIPLKDQGYSGNKDGIGVNMRGDMAVASIIGYVPDFEDHPSVESAFEDRLAGRKGKAFEGFKSKLIKLRKRGMSLYSVKQYPGRILAGTTIWVFDRTGELRSEDIIQGLGRASGIEIDQAGNLYTLFGMQRMKAGKPFLAGRLKVIGNPDAVSREYRSSTLMKTSPKGAKVYSKVAPISMERWPKRPTDVCDTSKPRNKLGAWVDGAEWLYAGAATVGFSGPRHSMDWHARSFVPENYRHSVGVVDTNGNLIMHVGRYGNADSGRGPDSPVKVGGDEIAFAHIKGVAASDKYLCVFDDGNLRMIILKMGYHEEEDVSVSAR